MATILIPAAGDDLRAAARSTSSGNFGKAKLNPKDFIVSKKQKEVAALWNYTCVCSTDMSIDVYSSTRTTVVTSPRMRPRPIATGIGSYMEGIMFVSGRIVNCYGIWQTANQSNTSCKESPFVGPI